MTLFGMQFEAVGGGSVKLKDLSGNFNGGPTEGEADNIMVWEDGIYTSYYYGIWNDPDNPDWDNLWYHGDEDASDVEIDPGIAAWYVRIGDATTLTISGAVKLTPTVVTIRPNDMTLFTTPYPTAVTLSSLNVVNPTGGPTEGEADNIMIWKDGIYTSYYYGVWNDPDNPDWDNLWYLGDEDASDVTIDPGIAAWYVRMGGATTMSFTSPLAK